MKVTKKVTTTRIGSVNGDTINYIDFMDFNGGKDARKYVRKRLKDGYKIFIDNVETKKCIVEISDKIIFENATITTLESEE